MSCAPTRPRHHDDGHAVRRHDGRCHRVENIFAWNGVGRLAIEAIFQRDYPMIQGFILVFAMVVVGVSILLDAIYALADPRIRRS